MKKLITLFLVITLVTSSYIMPVLANQITQLESLASKTSYELDENTGKYKIELKVPGGDGTNNHDEVILMVDGSYSMDNEWPAMKEAIIEIGKTVLNGNGNTQLTLMAFGMGDNEVIGHVKNVTDLENYLGTLPGTLLYGRSSTNCEAGFTGVEEYIDNHDETLKDAYVVFISDGNINTDETLHNFYNWKQNTWLRYSVKNIIAWNFDAECGHIANGGNPSEAFKTVFKETTNIDEIYKNATDEQKEEWADLAWENVYKQANLDPETQYPVSTVERAFVSYDKNNGTYLQDLFYYALIGRKYPNSWTRTPLAGTKLANHEKVKNLYMVDYDSYSSWMDTGITSNKSEFIKSNGITGLVEALSNVITDLSVTPYNDVVVTDYMSKWVNIDLNSIKIINDTTDEIIYTVEEGWRISESLRPTNQESPVKIELITKDKYNYGGIEVIGNEHNEIYKLTWNVKDGALLRSENYHLEYNVTMDTKEQNFEYNKEYNLNGNTTIKYKDENNQQKEENIKVPTGHAKNPTEGFVKFDKGTASHIAYLYIDENNNIEYLNKIDFTNKDTKAKLPYKEGYTLVVFIKQAKSGMIWTSNKVSDETLDKIIKSIKTNDKAYKGHDSVVYGNGKHILSYTNGNKNKVKKVTYTFE